MRLLLSDIISETSDMVIVGTAVDGKDAAEQAKKLKPDILLLDMNMGEYDGIYAVKRIMNECPLPIVILSAVGNSDLQPIFDALEHGAVDYINKPQRGNAKIRQIETELFSKIKSACRANPKVIRPKELPVNTHVHTFDSDGIYEVIVIGASTGGPTAVEKVITTLPSNLTVPVLLVQHMPSNFIGSFVNRLNNLTPLDVVIGKKNMIPKPGQIIVAPGMSNMIITGKNRKRKIDFTDEVFREYNNPSINALMLSVAENYGNKAIGVILTGMGKDGTKGMKQIHEKGGLTIAQSEKTCVIYGMPKSAVDNNAVARSIDIDEIGGYLVNSL